MVEIIEKGLGSPIIDDAPLDTEGIWEKLNRQQIVTHGLGRAA